MFTRKQRREARKLEQVLARTLNQPKAMGVNFKTVTQVEVLPGLVRIEGTDAKGRHTVETQVIPDPQKPPIRYYVITGDSR